MTQSTRNEVLGCFREFGQLDRLDIAYCDITEYLPLYVTRLTGHEGSLKDHKEASLNDPINQKKGI